MKREFEILMEVAAVVFGSYDIDLSEFYLKTTLDGKYILLSKDSFYKKTDAEKKAEDIKSKLPNNLDRLINIKPNVESGYNIFMPICILWDLITIKLPHIKYFINSVRTKTEAEKFTFTGIDRYNRTDCNSIGLLFRNYGWACTSEVQEKKFACLPLEFQTLMYAMAKTGCYYLDVRFDIDPAVFQQSLPLLPTTMAQYFERALNPTPVSFRMVV